MNAWPVRNTATRRHSMFKAQSLLKISVNKEPWCFHCNQKFASLFKTKWNASKATMENNIKSNNQTENIKALKNAKSIYLCTKQKERKIIAHSWKSFNHGELRGGMNNRDELFNHDLAVLFLKLNTCLLSYNRLLQPEEVEGAQAEYQS